MPPDEIEPLFHGWVFRGHVRPRVTAAVWLKFGLPIALTPLITLVAVALLEGDPLGPMVGIGVALGAALLVGIAGVLSVAGRSSTADLCVDHGEGRVIVGNTPMPLEGFEAGVVQGNSLELRLRSSGYVLTGEPDALQWVVRHLHEGGERPPEPLPMPAQVTPNHHGWTADVEVRAQGNRGFGPGRLEVDPTVGTLTVGGWTVSHSEVRFVLKGADTAQITWPSGLVVWDLRAPHETLAWMIRHAGPHTADVVPEPQAIRDLRRRDTER